MKKILIVLIQILYCIPVICYAVEDSSQYIEPHDITNEQWSYINQEIRLYNDCLRQEMVKRVEKGNDPRTLSNQLLETCSGLLIELQEKMDNDNINPQFTERFIYTHKNRAARQMLGAIMMMMSQQPTATPQTENAKEIDQE